MSGVPTMGCLARVFAGLMLCFSAVAAGAGERWSIVGDGEGALSLASGERAKGRLGESRPALPSPITRSRATALSTDLGLVLGVLTGRRQAMDLPIALGDVHMVRQNGVWMDDRMTGVDLSLPALRLNGAAINDLSVFAGFEGVTTGAFSASGGARDEKAALIGASGATRIGGGRLDLGAAYVFDRRDGVRDLGYANVGASFRRNYGRRLSNVTRFIGNFGAAHPGAAGSARAGVMVLSENALRVTASNRPYANLWWGAGGAHPAARARAAGGLLRHMGAGFRPLRIKGLRPLDAGARDGAGGAIGLRRQIVEDHVLGVEAAAMFTRDAAGDRNPGQYALSAEYAAELDPGLSLRGRVGYIAKQANDRRVGARVEVSFRF